MNWVALLAFWLKLCVVYGQQQSVLPENGFGFERIDGLDLTKVPDRNTKSKCYSDSYQPQKCVPDFLNAAFGKHVIASNTCGVSRRQQYCLQTGYGSRKSCAVCDANVPSLSHPASYLTDFNNIDNLTWWQSESMWDMGDSNQINLTLSLGKAYDITYVRLFFRSPRPQSFAIYKRNSPDSEWIPYQFYSGACRQTYNLPDSTYVPRDHQTRAICTSEFSDISPLTGGTVAFSTLEHRPSAYDFENSEELQEWVTATEIMITLDNLNTFGDEVFGDPKVLRSYFFAITDLAVGGRCKCNGHASECLDSTGYGGSPRKVCVCEHFTSGVDCGECQPFYHDAPWGRATSNDSKECKHLTCKICCTVCRNV